MALEVLGSLRAADVCRSLPEPVLDALASAAENLSYARDETIIAMGQPGERMHILLEGAAEARIRTEGGVAVPVAKFGPGDCFGEMSLFTGEPTCADVVALADCRTLAVNRDAFDRLLNEHPQLLREFVRIVSRRLRHTDETVGATSERVEQLAQFIQEHEGGRYSALVGRDPVTKKLEREVLAQQQGAGPLLIVGERGVGKELIARQVHFGGRTKDGPLLRVDCTQVLETPWGDPLFGGHHADGNGAGPSRTLSYLELAAGGSILLKNVEALSPVLQERLAEFLTSRSHHAMAVRVLATVRADQSGDLAESRLNPRLAAAFGAGVLQIPPLRERKRDIPHLAQHALAHSAERLGKPVESFDDDALTALINHDYRIDNVRELETVVDRAAILTDQPSIAAEAIFLGQPPERRPMGFNLLRLPQRLVRPFLRFFPNGARAIVAAVFALIIVDCFAGTHDPEANLGNWLAWRVWWPALFVSFFLFGRIWCAVCPMSTAGLAAQRRWHRELKVPAWIKDHDAELTMAGFFLIIWVEEYASMRADPRATGLLLLTIAACAVTVSILYPRRTWCRHLCPLGGLAGANACSSMLEIRPTTDICVAKCKGHLCYIGSDGMPGCPMFQHLMFVDSNEHCVMCMNCVRNCQNGSPQLNFRPPAAELFLAREGRRQPARFVAMLAGLLPVTLIRYYADLAPQSFWHALAAHQFLFVTLLLAVGAAIPLALEAWLSRSVERQAGAAGTARLWARLLAWMPLVGACYTAYELSYLPGASLLWGVLRTGGAAQGQAVVTYPVLGWAQMAVICLGLGITSLVVLRQRMLKPEGGPEPWPLRARPHLLGAALYALAVGLQLAAMLPRAH